MATFSRTGQAVRSRAGGERNARGQFRKQGGVVVEGVDAVVSNFRFRADSIRPLAAQVAVSHAERAANLMRDRVPVRHGNVLDSITADEKATTDRSGVYADAGPDTRANKAAFVARFLEHGTVKMAPRPFVGPAADQVLPEFHEAIRLLARP
jgi:HK97 gp10 family phage protein